MFSTPSVVRVTLQLDSPVDIPFSTGESNAFSIISNSRYSSSIGNMIFVDSYGLFNNYALKDGLGITFSLEVGDRKRNFDHRIFSVKKDPGSHGTIYTINTIPNKPKWIIESTRRVLRGTSSDVIGELASTCGISPVVDPTSDSMNWCGANRRISNFARFVADHGYVSEESLMVLGYTMDDRLLYRNWNSIDIKQPKTTFSYVPGVDGGILIYNHELDSESGFFNIFSGYQHRMVDQQLTAPGQYDRVRVRQIADDVMINEQLRGEIRTGRVEFGPILHNSVHPNYMRARYQNTRGRFAMSTGLKVESNFQSDVELFDPVNVSVDTNDKVVATGSPRTLYDGNYIVSAKALSVVSNKYFEAFMLTRDGMNNPRGGT